MVTPPRAVRAASSVPSVHRKNVLGFRIACEQTFGRGAYEQTLRLLPDEVRAATAGLVPMDEWVPESFIMAWSEAVWRGPAAGDEQKMRRYVDATIENGFGRVRRFLLGMLTPATIAARAAPLWREEHTTGELEAEVVQPHRLRVTLRDHPYTSSPLLRLSVAEAFRCIVSLTRASNVRVRHTPRGEPLLMHIDWDDGDAT